MSHGKTIRIYLADRSAAGIRHAEVVNWTGQAIVCPRARIGELSEWPESQRPGVYILAGDDPKGSRPLAYIGEAENVLTRLKNHVRDPKKEFWDRVVLFTSKDENLTKSHVKYLEAKMVALASEIDRVSLENGTVPNVPLLPRADRAAMNEFIDSVRMLLGALGFNILQAIAKKAGSDAPGPTGPLSDQLLCFRVKKRGIEASGYSTDEGFVVLKGSRGDSTIKNSLSKGWRTRREELIADRSLSVEDKHIVFQRDVLFRSPSAAVSTVYGGSWSGQAGWKATDGRTLGELEDALLDGDAKPEA